MPYIVGCDYHCGTNLKYFFLKKITVLVVVLVDFCVVAAVLLCTVLYRSIYFIIVQILPCMIITEDELSSIRFV